MASTAVAPKQLAEGVHRLGNELFNFYLVDEGGRATLVDAGLPGFRGQLEAHLRAIGRALGDIDAVILTHAHVDHVGIAEGVRRDAGARVHVHEADAEMARTGRSHPREGGMAPYLRHRATWRLLAAAARLGGMRPTKIADVATFAGEDALDVPGRPRIVATPGHSPGHVAFHFPDRGVLIAGDALCTYNPLTGARGPQLMPRPFAWSNAQALASLGALEQLEADVMLVGHGEPWTQGIRAAVAEVRERGAT